MRPSARFTCVAYLSCGFIGFGSAPVTADESLVANWSRFRGGDATGVSKSSGLPEQWSTTENVEWKVDIAGRGWGSPIVWGDTVFLSTVVNSGETEPLKKGLYFGGDRPDIPKSNHQWKVLCIDLPSGMVRWEKTVHEGPPGSPIHLKNSFASETPVTDGQYVYVCFGNLGIYCFDFVGDLVWTRALPPRPMRNGWGTAASPVLHGDVLYFLCDNDQRSTLTALDKMTRQELWSVERDEKSNWSTPFVWSHHATTEIVTAGTGAVRSYDLNGKELWSLRGMSSITIATPYAVDGLLYVSSGYVLDTTKAVYAIKPGATGDLTLPKGQSSSEFISWSNMKIAPYNPTTLVHNGRLFSLFDRGLVSCFNARSGEALYENQILQRGKAFTASPVCGDGKLYLINEDGVSFVIREGDSMELLATNRLEDDDICLATPAIAGDRLLIRTDKRLYCIRNHN